MSWDLGVAGPLIPTKRWMRKFPWNWGVDHTLGRESRGKECRKGQSRGRGNVNVL